MAAAISALNARIRSNPVSNYVCSTHLWGPVSNFGIPIAAVLDTYKEPDIISGTMTGALIAYSATFMRYAFAVTPRNYLLFGCHVVNFGAQVTQMYRYQRFWFGGGKEAASLAGVAAVAHGNAAAARDAVLAGSARVEGGLEEGVAKARDGMAKVEGKVREAVGK